MGLEHNRVTEGGKEGGLTTKLNTFINVFAFEVLFVRREETREPGGHMDPGETTVLPAAPPFFKILFHFFLSVCVLLNVCVCFVPPYLPLYSR